MTVTVALVGRPNVGKSTLFNRLVGKRLALVDDTPGLTRDRREGKARLGRLDLRLIDTAGLEDADAETLEGRMLAQTESAVDAADAVFFLIDARIGVTPLDSHFAQWLRKKDRPVVLVANKCEGRKADAGLYEAFSLGLGQPIPISAEHGEGVLLLEDALRDVGGGEILDGLADDEDSGAAAVDAMRIAIVGRPNVGKSTLVNKLVGEERMLTGEEAGVTRDAISVELSWDGRPVRLFDTAGMRRRARVRDRLEKISVADGLNAIRFAEVVVLLMDSDAPLEKQDLQIARMVEEEGRVLVAAVNKWDLVAKSVTTRRRLQRQLADALPQLRGVPLVTLSALTGEGIDRLMPAIGRCYATWNKRVPTGGLNRWLAQMTESHPPPAVRGRRLRLRYITQVKARPPTFALFVSRADALPESYVRYLRNGLRDAFGLDGVPLRINLRKGKNPYAKD